MGMFDHSIVVSTAVSERNLLAELSRSICEENGIYADLRTHDLRCLTDQTLTKVEAERRAYAAYEADNWGETGYYAPVYSHQDVTERRETLVVTVAAESLDPDGRLSEDDMAAAVAKVRVAKGEFIQRSWASTCKVVARKIGTVVPKEKTVTRYYAVVGTTVDFSGKGHASQAEARKAAEEGAKTDRFGYDVKVKEINVIGVTKRESGAALLTVTNAPTKVEVEVTVEIAAVKPGATQSGWYVLGSYHH